MSAARIKFFKSKPPISLEEVAQSLRNASVDDYRCKLGSQIEFTAQIDLVLLLKAGNPLALYCYAAYFEKVLNNPREAEVRYQQYYALEKENTNYQTGLQKVQSVEIKPGQDISAQDHAVLAQGIYHLMEAGKRGREALQKVTEQMTLHDAMEKASKFVPLEGVEMGDMSSVPRP